MTAEFSKQSLNEDVEKESCGLAVVVNEFTDTDPLCSHCQRNRAHVNKIEKEIIDFHKTKEYYSSSEDPRPRPGKMPPTIAEHYKMMEFVGGSGIYVYFERYHEIMQQLRCKLKPGTKPPAAWIASELLNMFYDDKLYKPPPAEAAVDQDVINAVITLALKEGTGNKNTVVMAVESKTKQICAKKKPQTVGMPFPVPVVVGPPQARPTVSSQARPSMSPQTRPSMSPQTRPSSQARPSMTAQRPPLSSGALPGAVAASALTGAAIRAGANPPQPRMSHGTVGPHSPPITDPRAGIPVMRGAANASYSRDASTSCEDINERLFDNREQTNMRLQDSYHNAANRRLHVLDPAHRGAVFSSRSHDSIATANFISRTIDGRINRDIFVNRSNEADPPHGPIGSVRRLGYTESTDRYWRC